MHASDDVHYRDIPRCTTIFISTAVPVSTTGVPSQTRKDLQLVI
jgi:hypothetical protein